MRRLSRILALTLPLLLLLTGTAIYLLQEKALFIVAKTPAEYKYHFKRPYTERYFLNKNEGHRIHGLQFKKEGSQGVILYFHGNAYDLMSWGGIYENFTRYPFDFVIVDYRGFGKSEGKINRERDFFTDAQIIYETLKSEYGEQSIILYGRSLGSASASYLAAHNHPKLVVLETPFYSLKRLVTEIASSVIAPLLKYPFENYVYLQQASSPIHIIHGSHDELISVKHSQDLAALIKNKSSFTEVPKGNHNNLSDFDIYYKALDKIFIN